jgi:hypothetical protein
VGRGGARTYGVDGALEVLGGAVGGEHEEERGGENVHVGGVAPPRGSGEERLRGGLLVAAGVHGERILETSAREGCECEAAGVSRQEKILEGFILRDCTGGRPAGERAGEQGRPPRGAVWQWLTSLAVTAANDLLGHCPAP